MRVLITGVTGMVGSHMAEFLLARGDVEVFGTYRWRSKTENLDELKARGLVTVIEGGLAVDDHFQPEHLNLVEANLADAFSMARLIDGVRPDRIFHLAAQSYVPASWREPAETISLNVIGQVNLLEAVRAAGIDPVIHIAGSSEEYGLVFHAASTEAWSLDRHVFARRQDAEHAIRALLSPDRRKSRSSRPSVDR